MQRAGNGMNLPNALTLARIFLVPLLVVVLLTKFEGRLILGVRKELAKQLRARSVEPAAITDIVLTHAHYDHSVNFTLFPNATVWIGAEELAWASRQPPGFNPLPELLSGKRVVVVDDSIVRGTTTAPIVAMLRRAGAAEVHVRIHSPEMRHPCYMGVDTGRRGELIASTHATEKPRTAVPSAKSPCGVHSPAGMHTSERRASSSQRAQH